MRMGARVACNYKQWRNLYAPDMYMTSSKLFLLYRHIRSILLR
jgi:hypothetical protein